ncbi:MAG: potassium transporter TrkG [Leptospiraceae bacterium]|nr:potassium transporter TrkG [Leptospiraceae bacterium]
MITNRKLRVVRLGISKFYIWFSEFRHDTRKNFLTRFGNIGYSILIFSGIISLITLTIEFGFYFPQSWNYPIRIINQIVIWYFIFYQLVAFLFALEDYRSYFRNNRPEVLITLLVLLQKIFESSIVSFIEKYELKGDEATLIFLAINQVFFSLSGLITLFRNTRIYNFNRVNPSLMFAMSFFAIIMFGTFLLSLPKAQAKDIPLVDIFFTVISATCVTGLSTIDISVNLTRTGQVILLFLIQIGGLGLITLTTFFSIFLAGQASVNDRLLMKDLLSEEALGKVRSLIKDIAVQTFLIEIFGAILLYLSFPNIFIFTTGDKIFLSIFHSISAFCNAGFSLFPKGLAEEFIVKENFFLTTIIILIIMGGIGFSVLGQVFRKYLTRNLSNERFTISSKLAISLSFGLILVGTIAYLILEDSYTLKNKDFDEKLFHSLFYSVTTRTAGFNTLDISAMGIPMVFFSLLLMWIGASPNSTGGGIKTTTFAVSFLQIFDFVRGKSKVEIFKREVAQSTLFRAGATIVLSLFVIFSAIFGMVLLEKFSFLDICYEVVSAFATVGLTRGITTNLSSASKLILCFVMFAGRVGILTILIAIIPKKESHKYDYPKEYVIVG